MFRGLCSLLSYPHFPELSTAIFVMHAESPSFPKLRSLNIQAIHYQGAPSLLLQDPFQLAGQYMILPQVYGPALYLLDGTRDISGVRQELALRFGLGAEEDAIEQLVAALDELYFLENARFRQAYQEALARYYQLPHRPMLLAGEGYPADPAQLKAQFDAYLAEVGPVAAMPPSGRLIFSPHIDYARGHEVYAQVWKAAEAMARAAELVIILGTDHYGDYNPITLTRQSYATPYGILPNDQLLVDRLARAVGGEQAFAGELYHLGEHSLELVLVWMHHMRGGEPVPTIPILAGSLLPFLDASHPPADDPVLARFLAELRSILRERPHTLVIASGDLAHVGPAFDGEPVDEAKRAQIRQLDDEMLRLLAAGDAEGFWGVIKRVRDENNVCGVAPFYLSLKAVGAVEGARAGYAVCPADDRETSVVTIAGVAFG
ncbi:MAG TPA: AmmeMemoRadiSam system protein B [Anaerolineae bacterium]|nr:AmmeMemoRadiSam system protein B [Anaerolineae bacterium]